MRITLDQLSKAYGYFWALKGLDLQINAGERVALLGPNGAGKTTLLKLLAGLIYPTRGEILLDGARFTRQSISERSVIGLLSPGDHLYENMTARENLEFFAALYDIASGPAPIGEVLADVGLARWSGEYVGSLSSGMKCRLSVAKWKLIKPKLLLLDEPYGVLDGSGVDLLESFLNAQSEQGSVVIIASHHVARVLDLCTRAIILDQGNLTFDEPRREPWDSFANAFGAFLPGSNR